MRGSPRLITAGLAVTSHIGSGACVCGRSCFRGLQAWHRRVRAATAALAQVRSCLAAARHEASGETCALLKDAIEACGDAADRSRQYLAGRLLPRPELAADLSGAILALHHAAKQAALLCKRAQGALREALTAFWAGEPRSTDAAADTAAIGDARPATTRETRGDEDGTQQSFAMAELMLLGNVVVDGAQKHTDLLQAIVGCVGLETLGDELAAYDELLAIEPYLEEGALSSLVAAFPPPGHAASLASEPRD